VPAPRKYEYRSSFTFNAEGKNLEAIKEIAHKEHISAGEKLNNLMASEIQRYQIMQPQQPQPNPLGLPCNGVAPSTTQQQKEPKEEQQVSDGLKITLGSKILGRNDWKNILANVDNPHILQACITSGKMLSVVAQERLSEVQTQKRLEAKKDNLLNRIRPIGA
jgi:hypothetical protein